MRQIEERAAIRRPLKPAARATSACLDRSRLLLEIAGRLAVAEPAADPADARVDRQDRVVGGKQQHPMRARLAELRKRLERAPRRTGSGPADDLRQIGRAAEQIDASPQRLSAGSRGRDRRAPRSLRVSSAARATSRPASAPECASAPRAPHRASRRRMDRQHFPDEERERIARRRRQRAIKFLQRIRSALSSLDTGEDCTTDDSRFRTVSRRRQTC